MLDVFTRSCAGLLTGVYRCVDRVVINAFLPLGTSAGGFRHWWRLAHGGSDARLSNTALIRMAGRFSRRVRGWARSTGVPIIDCTNGERKHELGEAYLAAHPEQGPGVFMVLVARAKAPIWQVRRVGGVIVELYRKDAYVNHYSFHILDPEWGHVTVKMSGHPPFGAQIILNGHEWVSRAAQADGIALTMDGNCFTAVADPVGLAQIADTLSQDAAIGRLRQVCQRWIYTACLCFGLDLDQQAATDFTYQFSVHQVELSHNLLFQSGGQLQDLFDRVVDRTRARLDVPILRTIFGAVKRPYRNRKTASSDVALVVETPRYGLTIFKVNFGRLTVKAYTKGEHVLRLEAVVHNTHEFGTGHRALEAFPTIVARLTEMVDQFATVLDCVDVSFLPTSILDQLPQPAQVGATRVGGLDLNKPRLRHVLTAVLALAPKPGGFTVADLTSKVHRQTGRTDYTTRQAAYDLKKLRGKNLLDKPPRTRRYHLPPKAARIITALLTLREHVITPILAGVRSPRRGPRPTTWTAIDRHYETMRGHMATLFDHLGINTAAAAA